MAVVDQSGQVHGLEGLRVVDASIRPNLVCARINPTVLRMGERRPHLSARGSSAGRLQSLTWTRLPGFGPSV